ncbi:hypothetical protein Tco_0875422 [Tanacetum coccineum]|uniref:Retrovirus-related Pol polyprotein from transposon TNT 1-94-like beta-barrel domain-containing protein n=1 Tax=Tanacetum coccineum TaxID=301880 RepID=A0ABQ5BPD9_9ASTR
MIIKKDSKIVKAKGERKSLALKAKKESSDEESLTSDSEDEEYAMAARDFRKFFKRRGRCGDPNHLIIEFPKPSKDKNQREFVGGSWSDSGEEDDEKAKEETCLMAHVSSEIYLVVDLEPDKWIKDSGCSNMTGNRKPFSTYKAYNGGNIIFGSNLFGNIIGKGTICDNKCKVTFFEHDSEISKDGKVISREPKNVNKALKDESWIITMQEELNQFIANDVWELVPQPKTMKIIGTKWVYRNKLEENCVVSRNKARYKLTKDEECESVDNTKYRGMIGSLLYLTESRPDIMFSVCLYERFQEDPKTSHLEAVKSISQYIKDTTHLGLWYLKGTDIETIVYADSDHADIM